MYKQTTGYSRRWYCRNCIIRDNGRENTKEEGKEKRTRRREGPRIHPGYQDITYEFTNHYECVCDTTD